ncbi:amidase [Humitalea sp. 24SJ18S-53]|uniref:amidase n=1 Tax=Humitalea sp. 24SJ18S-53 TaxID=3422307 RepID=UPI003D66BA64
MDAPLLAAPERLGAAAARRAIAAGSLTATALLEACLERIAARNGTVAAWASIDIKAARAQARALDAGPEQGLLHGLPFGVKDIIDTADQPAGYGSPIYTGHRPGRDGATVASPLAAGAILLGKTVTTEFANRHPGPTRNPHDVGRTPGGSSSGSAAAVGDFQVPLALGTQTGGSVLRPAAYCGVVGFKPSFQHFGNSGVRTNTEAYDTVGLMARAVEDIALLRAAVMEIPHRAPVPATAPRIAITRTAHWGDASAATQAAIAEAARAFAAAGAIVTDLDLPPEFAGLRAAHRVVCGFESVRNYADELNRSGHLVSQDFRDERASVGEVATLAQFRAAIRLGNACRARMDAIMVEQGFDALLTPSATDEAPLGLAHTGQPVFNYLWTNLAMPCITLPFVKGPNGMPIGVQLVARRHEDASLLDVAAWAERVLAG